MNPPMNILGGLVADLHIGSTSAAAQRTPSLGRGAIVGGYQHMHVASYSRDEAIKDEPKTPGELLAQDKNLLEKLSTLLKHQNPPVTDLQSASQGFKNLGQFVTAVHDSHNLGIPFEQLKTQMQKSDSLGRAIHAPKMDVDAKAEAKKTAKQSDGDIEESSQVPERAAGDGL